MSPVINLAMSVIITSRNGQNRSNDNQLLHFLYFGKLHELKS